MQSGEVVLLKELQLDRHIIGKYVRVTGHITMIDFANHVCQIEHVENVLMVDITLIDLVSNDIKVSSLVQFIGEIRNTEQSTISLPSSNGKVPFYLQAKVARLVDGLDMTLYEQALLARRTFLQRAKDV